MAALLFRSAVAVCATATVSGEVPGAGDTCSLVHQTWALRSCGGSSAATSFSDFVVRHERAYSPGSEEYKRREALFETRAAAVRAQNCESGQRWTAGINKLADRTPEELRAIRGFNRHWRASSASSAESGAVSGDGSPHLALLSLGAAPTMELPPSLDWADKLSSLREVPDQGGCGSCWAVAASTMLRSQSEIHAQARNFSVQEMVSCVPNKDHCGGTGGCSGATIEMAADYVLKYGNYTEQSFPYIGEDGVACPSDRTRDLEASLVQRAASGNRGEAFGMTGWMRLPQNKLHPVMHALVVHGPLGVSLAVEANFEMYESGILSACKAAVIDHAVVLVGYGEEPAVSSGSLPSKYWRLQNSWGPYWGEHGYARLSRKEDAEEEKHCFWDEQPEVGSGCDGGPKRVWVCGSCGVLSETVSAIWAGGPGDKSQHAQSHWKDVLLRRDPATSATIAQHQPGSSA